MTAETLFVTSDLTGSTFYLKDASGLHISSTSDRESLIAWAKENGYRVQYSDGGKVQWA